MRCCGACWPSCCASCPTSGRSSRWSSRSRWRSPSTPAGACCCGPSACSCGRAHQQQRRRAVAVRIQHRDVGGGDHRGGDLLDHAVGAGRPAAVHAAHRVPGGARPLRAAAALPGRDARPRRRSTPSASTSACWPATSSKGLRSRGAGAATAGPSHEVALPALQMAEADRRRNLLRAERAEAVGQRPPGAVAARRLRRRRCGGGRAGGHLPPVIWGEARAVRRAPHRARRGGPQLLAQALQRGIGARTARRALTTGSRPDVRRIRPTWS